MRSKFKPMTKGIGKEFGTLKQIRFQKKTSEKQFRNLVKKHVKLVLETGVEDVLCFKHQYDYL